MPRHFLFLQLFDNKEKSVWDRAEEQLTQGLWVCWLGQVSETGEMDKNPPRSFLRRTTYRSHVQTHRGQTLSQKRHNFSHEEANASNSNASITGQPTCSYDMYGKNDLALQLFFFSPLPQDNCWDFDFNAFCVVLYFHAKILLYLNVFILLNVFKFFWLLYPRIAVIIHVAVSNFFLWKRSEKRERKKKH